MHVKAWFLMLLFVTVIFLPLAGASPQQSPMGPPAGQIEQQQRREEPSISPEIERKMAKERTKERYQSLKRDSEKLLELATELKQYVDKSGENVLSMDVIKKCDEIEKLSKSVRTKMKGE